MGDVQAIAAALASGTSWGSLVSFLNTAPETTSTISDSKVGMPIVIEDVADERRPLVSPPLRLSIRLHLTRALLTAM